MSNSSLRRIIGVEYSFIRVLMILNIVWVATFAYRDLFKAVSVIRELLRRHKQLLGKAKMVRAFKNGNRYYWDIFNPGWPSKAFDHFFLNQLHEVSAVSEGHTSLRRVLVAITKKCPLNCEHCSEGDTLNQKDLLSYEELQSKLQHFVDRGVGQLVYSGGEPLHRFDDLVKLVAHFRDDCDQWIYTSGFGLTREKAIALRDAGLNGAAISLDHHEEAGHNSFRRNAKSFRWVLDALTNCREAGLFVAFNMCPTRDYIDAGGLEEYMDFAKSLQVPIVNILEPRAVGNYAGKEVQLDGSHRKRIRDLVSTVNFNTSHIKFPTIIYPGGYRDAWPCGGGRSYLLLDYDGTLYPCPFCKKKVEDVSLTETLCQAV
jgi:MoaA/NifB/PqqE/SkfB family radical SAM enzyme